MTDSPPAHPSSEAALRGLAASFARPDPQRGFRQLLTSFGPFLLACAAMHLAYPVSPLLTLALAVPTGALLLRVFIVQHDCGHNSFFRSRGANTLTGRLCSLITMTPYANWARQHSQHHASWNMLGRTSGTDIYTACLTVREYRALSPGRRWLHRLPRHPLVAHLLLPPLVFLLLYRVPFDTPPSWGRERRSVHLTNLALLTMFGGLAALVGWREVVTVHVSLIMVASILGVWLFSLQHRYDSSRWRPKEDWRFAEAALDGSSWLRLPRVLQWLTGNIGFHHVHHLNPHVPNYRLGAAHAALEALRPTPPLSLWRGLMAPRLALWDEATDRLVRFRDAYA